MTSTRSARVKVSWPICCMCIESKTPRLYNPDKSIIKNQCNWCTNKTLTGWKFWEDTGEGESDEVLGVDGIIRPTRYAIRDRTLVFMGQSYKLPKDTHNAKDKTLVYTHPDRSKSHFAFKAYDIPNLLKAIWEGFRPEKGNPPAQFWGFWIGGYFYHVPLLMPIRCKNNTELCVVTHLRLKGSILRRVFVFPLSETREFLLERHKELVDYLTHTPEEYESKLDFELPPGYKYAKNTQKLLYYTKNPKTYISIQITPNRPAKIAFSILEERVKKWHLNNTPK